MIPLKILTYVLVIGFFASCTSRTASDSNSTANSPDSAEVPGVGIAPDSSDAVSDSTIIRQQSDTATLRQQSDTTGRRNP